MNRQEERIRKLDAQYHTLMDEYQSLVLPYKLGDGMPEDIRNKASEVFNRAYPILEELRKLSNQYAPDTSSNASPIDY